MGQFKKLAEGAFFVTDFNLTKIAGYNPVLANQSIVFGWENNEMDDAHSTEVVSKNVYTSLGRPPYATPAVLPPR